MEVGRRNDASMNYWSTGKDRERRSEQFHLQKGEDVKRGACVETDFFSEELITTGDLDSAMHSRNGVARKSEGSIDQGKALKELGCTTCVMVKVGNHLRSAGYKYRGGEGLKPIN
ncbi:hypothetical protein Ae201684P_021780 [Aphanomyces euteiches]|nr:hypothetical protein Ae201684P_021780 [Aphanomyces euteiches]